MPCNAGTGTARLTLQAGGARHGIVWGQGISCWPEAARHYPPPPTQPDCDCHI